MKKNNTNPSVEMIKNLAAASFAGTAYGFLVATGFGLDFLLLMGFGMLFGLAIGFRITRKPPKMRYPMFLLRRILIAFGILTITGAAYSFILGQELTKGNLLLVSLIPLAGWIFFVVAIGMAIAHMDELQRRVQIEAIAVAFAGTSIFVGGYALLQFAGFPHLNLGIVIIIMAVMWLVGKIWTLWRYR